MLDSRSLTGKNVCVVRVGGGEGLIDGGMCVVKNCFGSSVSNKENFKETFVFDYRAQNLTFTG